jgi:glycosyltransferase 2 family protein
VSLSIKKIASLVVPLIIGISLIYYQFSSLTDQEITNIKNYFKNANYGFVVLSLLISLFGYWSRAYRWKFALQHLGYKTKFHNDLFAVCISYLVNLTIPRSGELTRAAILKKYENVPFDKGFGTIVAERVVDFAIFLIFVIIGFSLQFDKISAFIFKHVSPEKIIILASIGIIGFISFILIWLYAKWKIIITIKQKLAGLTEGMLAIFKMKDKWKYLFHSFAIWISYLLMFYVCIFALNETSNISFDVVVMGFIFGSLAVGFTNGGIGAFPVSIQAVLMLYGITKDAGAALGWIIWTSQTLLTIVLGLTSYVLLSVLNKK